ELLERAIALDPSNAEYWYNLGVAASEAGSPGRALEALGKATELAPQWAAAWAVLGQVQLAEDAIAEAETSLREALRLDPRSVFARHTMAILLRRLDRADEALALLGSQQNLPAETRLLRAHLLGDSFRFDEAAAAYRDLLRTQPHMLDAHETLARLLPQLGAREHALDSYRDVLAKEQSIELYR